ncbi:mucoidy inhibitor MuiA family protein [Pseudomonas aeruginosa]
MEQREAAVAGAARHPQRRRQALQARGPAGRPGATGTGRGEARLHPARRLLAADHYDARLRDGAKTIELTYQGLVRQSSGEDWTDVDLTLSTARPALGGNVPRLNPWIVDIDAPNAYYGTEMAMQDVPAPMPQAAPIARPRRRWPCRPRRRSWPRRGSPPRRSAAAPPAPSFHIPVPATLNSDGKRAEGHHRPPGNAGQAALSGGPGPARNRLTWRRRPATTATTRRSPAP